MTHDTNAFATGAERLQHPRPYIPTIESTQLNVGSDGIKTMLVRLGQLQIPLQLIKNSISLDGVSFEMQMGDSWTGVTRQSHNELPGEWPSILREIVRELNEIEGQHPWQ